MKKSRFSEFQIVSILKEADAVLKVSEIRRRIRVVGAFPDGNSAQMLAAAKLRHIAGTQWGRKRYLKMELLRDLDTLETHVA